MNSPRWLAAAVYLENVLVVVGGSGSGKSVELLQIDATTNAPSWISCSSTLPVEVYEHTLTLFRGKLILAGGYGNVCQTRT